MGSEIVTKGSHPMHAKRLSNPKCCRWAKFIFLPATTFLWTKCCLYLWYSSTEVKRPMSNLAFRRASAWPSWEAWAGRLPCAFEAPLSFLGAMKHYNRKEHCATGTKGHTYVKTRPMKEPVTRAGREDKPPVTRDEGGPLQNLTPRSEMWSRTPQNSLRRLATAGRASKVGVWKLNRQIPSTGKG